MNIVHVCRVGWPRVGGMESAIHGLACWQQRQGNTVRVITLDRLRSGEPRLRDGHCDGVVYQRIRSVGPARYPVPIGLKRTVGCAELVHIHGIDGIADLAVRTLDAPVGVSTHGGFFHTRRQWRLKQLWLRTLTRSTLSRARAVWFTSERDRERLRPANVAGSVIGNGVDVDRFVAKRQPEAGRWVMLGRVEPHKGLADLARWLPILPITLHVVGEVMDAAHVARVVDRLAAAGCSNRLVIHGELGRSGVAEQLSRAQILVAPSHAEGFGIAVVEAMGAGVPVCVSAGTALEERVADGGGWAIDFRAANAGLILQELASGEHAAVGERARQVSMRYGWDEVGKQWNEAYRRLVEG